MIEVIAIALIAVGIFFIIRGLTEKYDLDLYRQYEGQYGEQYEEFVYGDRLRRRHDEEVDETDEFKSKKKVKVGGVVLIGPIPIVFGNSKYAVYALILAIVLMLLSILFMFSANI